MALAALFNVPTNEQELLIWAHAHAQHHRDMNQIIQQQFNVDMPEFILDPLNPNAIEAWAAQHQALHNAMQFVLGLSGYDMSEPNFKDPAELSFWIQMNAEEHVQAGGLLNVA